MEAEDPKPPSLADLQREHGAPPGRRHAAPPGELSEQSPLRNYVRDLVLGYNDGLVSVYAATAGLAGAGAPGPFVLLAGLAAATAGALSMGAGEYISTKSQADYYRAERARESEHFEKWPELELQELRESLEAKGLRPPLVDQAVEAISADRERFLDYMMRDEFGVGRESERSPWAAAGFIMAAFLAGAAVAVFPYGLWTLRDALVASTLVSLGGLFLAGVARARASRLPAVRAGFEMVLIGAAAGAVTYALGRLVGPLL